MRQMTDELRRSFDGAGGGFLRIEVDTGPEPEPVPALIEPADMVPVPVEPPCHPWEPLKVADDWPGPLYCFYCGTMFAV